MGAKSAITSIVVLLGCAWDAGADTLQGIRWHDDLDSARRSMGSPVVQPVGGPPAGWQQAPPPAPGPGPSVMQGPPSYVVPAWQGNGASGTPAAPPTAVLSPPRGAMPGAGLLGPIAAPVLPPDGNPPLGLDGYCPVSFAAEKRWVKGDRRWSVIHRGQTYLLAGPEEARRFCADPESYAPVASGIDLVAAVEQIQAVPGRREHGAWYGGRPYLFASEETHRMFDRDPERYASAAPSPPSAASPPRMPDPIVTWQRSFNIPFRIEPADQPSREPVEVQLYVSGNYGKTWQPYAKAEPADGHFRFHAACDGESWFIIRTLDRSGTLRPANFTGPELRVIVDTVPPAAVLRARAGQGGQVTSAANAIRRQ